MSLLSAAAIIELAKVKGKLRLVERVAVNKVGWLRTTLSWCREHEIILGDDAPRQFWVTRAGIAAVERCLALDGQGSLQSQAESRLNGRDKVTSSNEKIARAQPMEQRVLCASCDLSQRLHQQQFFHLVDTPPQINVELSIIDIDLDQYDALVVIENRDSFNQWHQYVTLTQGIFNPLVIYRGHERAHSKGCVALKLLWQQRKGAQGLVYFGDADIAGLSIAVSGDVPYQHLLLPPLDELKVRLDPKQCQPHYDYVRGNLEQNLPSAWRPVFSLLNQRAALRQQNMFNLPLVLY